MVVEVFISFYRILTDMPRPKITRHKIKISVTIDPEIYNWVQEKIKTKEFSNITHAVERGLLLLKEQIQSKK